MPVSIIVHHYILQIIKLRPVYILAHLTGNCLGQFRLTNVFHYVKTINLLINYIHLGLELADHHALMDISLIIKLQDAYKDVLKLNLFIIRIFLQAAVLSFVLIKVMPIIKIKHAYIALLLGLGIFLTALIIILLIEFLKAVLNYALLDILQLAQINIVKAHVLDYNTLIMKPGPVQQYALHIILV